MYAPSICCLLFLSFDIDMKRSNYNTEILLKSGRYLIHNARCNSLAILEAEEKDLLNVGSEDLLKEGFFVPDDFDEEKSFREQFSYAVHDDRYMILSIMPTLACNFRCDYCYEGKEHCGSLMKESVCAAICEAVRREAYRLKQLHVCWYGGEPLIGISVIQRLSAELIEICRENKVSYMSSIVTNGYYLTKENAQILKEAGVTTVQITLDGARECHDQRRILADGSGTFDTIIGHIRDALDKNCFHFNIRVNIDRRNQDGIHQMFRQLEEAGLANHANLRVYFAPVAASTDACASISCEVISEVEYGRLESELIRQAFNDRLGNVNYPQYLASTCSAVKPLGFVILPDGVMHKCWHTVPYPERAVGTVFELAEGKDFMENDNYRMWRSFNPLNKAECADCKMLFLCAGACAHKHLISGQNPCLSMKHNLKSRLLMYALTVGMISADEIPAEAVPTQI